MAWYPSDIEKKNNIQISITNSANSTLDAYTSNGLLVVYNFITIDDLTKDVTLTFNNIIFKSSYIRVPVLNYSNWSSAQQIIPLDAITNGTENKSNVLKFDHTLFNYNYLLMNFTLPIEEV